MYNKEDFYYINYGDLNKRYQPYFKQLFNIEHEITEEQDTFDLVMEEIRDNSLHHIFQRLNMFFMFKDQYQIIEHRYLKRDSNNEIIETPWEMCNRVATFIALSEPRDRTSGMEKLNKWYPIFMIMLLDMKISPNTPTWCSAGIPGFGSFACSVVSNDDNLEAISKWYRDVIFMTRYNFGIGHSLHKFRPEGAPFGKSKTTTKSPLKWLNIIQEISTSMQQGNSGRGTANMVTIPVWHPTVLEFIDYKKTAKGSTSSARKLMKNVMNSDLDVETKENIINVIDKQIPLKNFNMSIIVNDKFMRAVENNSKWTLLFELPDKSWKQEIKVDALYIWDKIIKNAWESGDPGLMFFDRINKDNPVKNIFGDLYSSNPSLRHDTKILTIKGIFDIQKLENSLITVLNCKGEWKNAKCFKSGNNKRLYKITFHNNQVVYCTAEHKWPLISKKINNIFHKNGNVFKKSTKDLSKFDCIYIEGINSFPSVDSSLSYEDGLAIGWWYGDGWKSYHKLNKRTYYGFYFSYNNKYNGERILNWVNNIAKNKVKLKENKGFEVYSSDSNLVNIFEHKYKIENKSKFPLIIYQSNNQFIKGFISGIFSTDSHIDTKRNRIVLTSIHKNLLKDIQELLIFYGIRSRLNRIIRKEIKIKNYVYKNHEIFVLNLCGLNEIKRFGKIFTLDNISKQNKLNIIINKNQTNNTKINKLRIKSIKKTDLYEDVYDITVYDNTHTFMTNVGITGNCSEQNLPEFSICNLWTINLMKHIDFFHKTINWASIRDTINISVRCADNLITQNEYPKEVPELEVREKQERRIGIDYTGLADALFVLDIKYGSKESYELISKLYRHLRDNTRRYSVILGEKKGSFPLLKRSSLSYPNNKYDDIKKCPKCNSKVIRHKELKFIECDKCNWSKYKYLRNVDLTTQSPTGTRSRKLGVSFGIEPQVFKWWKSNVMEGTVVYNISHNLEWYMKKWCKENRHSVKHLISSIDAKEDNIIVDKFNNEVLKNWIESYELSPEQHLEVQSKAQQWISNGVSKTINLPENITPEDISRIYLLAWKKGLKGITVYRKGSHYKEVLTEDVSCPECKSKDLLFIEGCYQCKKCSWSKCNV